MLIPSPNFKCIYCLHSFGKILAFYREKRAEERKHFWDKDLNMYAFVWLLALSLSINKRILAENSDTSYSLLNKSNVKPMYRCIDHVFYSYRYIGTSVLHYLVLTRAILNNIHNLFQYGLLHRAEALYYVFCFFAHISCPSVPLFVVFVCLY